MKRTITTTIDEKDFKEIKNLNLKMNYLIRLGLDKYKEMIKK